MVEEVTQDHVPVVPAFARSVAFDLRSAYEGSSPWTEPPTEPDDVPQRPFAKAAEMLSIDEGVAADQQLCRSLKVCDGGVRCLTKDRARSINDSPQMLIQHLFSCTHVIT